MLPKQRQLQNSTLSIHTPVSMVWLWATSAPGAAVAVVLPLAAAAAAAAAALRSICRDGVGIMSGLMTRSRREPTRPTPADSRSPGLDRSMSHQSSGLARANVAEI